MKKIILILLATCLLFNTGCWVYGSGKTYGYVTTVEDGIFWDFVWVRAELESSQTDCYVIHENNNKLKSDLRIIAENKNRVELQFNRHIFTLTMDCLNDEITYFRIIGE